MLLTGLGAHDLMTCFTLIADAKQVDFKTGTDCTLQHDLRCPLETNRWSLAWPWIRGHGIYTMSVGYTPIRLLLAPVPS